MNSRCHDQVKRVLLSYDILGKITREREREIHDQIQSKTVSFTILML